MVDKKSNKLQKNWVGKLTATSNLITVLQEIQGIYGYLPREVMYQLSQATGTPISKIYGVITFYAQFYLSPRGKNIVRICRGTACHVKNADSVKDKVKELLKVADGETTPDFKFTLETVACLGTCFLAPVMMINNDYYGKLTAKKVKKIFDSYEDTKQNSINKIER